MSVWDNIRRNHALEHATVAVIARRRGGKFPVFALSDPAGFTLIASSDLPDAATAPAEALARLQSGESGLAVTDDCGTSLLATALLSTTVVVALTRRRALANLPLAVTAAILIGRFSPRIGRWLQSTVTLDTWLQGTTIETARSISLPGGLTLIRVSTAHEHL